MILTMRREIYSKMSYLYSERHYLLFISSFLSCEDKKSISRRPQPRLSSRHSTHDLEPAQACWIRYRECDRTESAGPRPQRHPERTPPLAEGRCLAFHRRH